MSTRGCFSVIPLVVTNFSHSHLKYLSRLVNIHIYFRALQIAIMRSFTLFTGLLALIGNTLSVPAPATSKVFEKLNSVPQGWTEVRPAATNRRLHFRIALEQQNQALFEQTLLDVSTPNHPQYGYVVLPAFDVSALTVTLDSI